MENVTNFFQKLGTSLGLDKDKDPRTENTVVPPTEPSPKTTKVVAPAHPEDAYEPGQIVSYTPPGAYKFSAAAEDEPAKNSDQLVYYHAGVGTGTKQTREEYFEGLFGNIDKELQDAYRWLSLTYKEGDEIYGFGFSRGATIIRSLFGFIRNVGLVKGKSPELANRVDFDRVIKEGYSIYQERPIHPEKDPEGTEKYLKKAADFKLRVSFEKVNLKFLGVFDTVGELGVPQDLRKIAGGLIERIGQGLGYIEKNEYHDTKVSDEVPFAYHALAIDETREMFAPTLFENVSTPPPPTIIEREQIWFRGEHSDIGGGWFEQGLPNIALYWMVDKARRAGCRMKDPKEFEIIGKTMVMGVNKTHMKHREAFVVHDPFVGKAATTSYNEKIYRDFQYYQDATRFFPSTLHPSVFVVARDVPCPPNLADFLTRADPEAVHKYWPVPTAEQKEEDKKAVEAAKQEAKEHAEIQDAKET
ncbi:hypothetical protein HDV00_002728 [Rhizophlyctis rosea]|nr:hypothetical protein HDV00_002728 [Rhizophlyctis rosea]